MKMICMLALALAFLTVAGGCRGEVDVDDKATISQPR